MALPVHPFRLRHTSSHRLSLSPEFDFVSPQASRVSPEPSHAKAMNGAATKRKKAKPRVKKTSDVSRSGSLPIQSQGHSGSHLPSPKHQPIDLEIPRKVLHSSVGFITVHLYTSYGNQKTVIIVLSAALAVIIPADVLRFRFPWFERLYERVLGFLMRESEKHKTNGVIWYILGAVTVLAVFPLDIATVAILTLSWADSAASTFGRLFGASTPPLPRRLPLLGLPMAPRKSLAGFIAAAVTGSCIAFTFWGWIGPLRPGPLSWTWERGLADSFKSANLGMGKIPTGGCLGLSTIALVTGLVAGIAEALDVGSLDDNLTLPIICGTCLYGFLKLMGLLAA